MPKNVQILLRRGALVFGNSYCTLRARMRQGEKAGCIRSFPFIQFETGGPRERPCRGATFLPFLKYDTWRLVFARKT